MGAQRSSNPRPKHGGVAGLGMAFVGLALVLVISPLRGEDTGVAAGQANPSPPGELAERRPVSWGGGPLEVQWKRDTGRCIEQSPILTESRIFVQTTDRKVWAYDLQSGDKIWRRKFKEDLPAPLGFVSGVEKGARLFCFVGDRHGTLYCLDAANGETVWDIEAARPVAAQGVGDRVLVQDVGGDLVCRETLDGSEVWTFARLGWDAAPFLEQDGRVFALARRDSVHALVAETGELEWTTQIVGEYLAAPRLLGGELVVCSTAGRLTRLDPTSGVVLGGETRAAMQVSAAAWVDGKIVTVSSDGRVEARRPGAATAEWTYDLKRAVESPPVAAGVITLVAAHEGSLWALRSPTGEPAWSLELSGGLRVAPLLTERHLVVANSKGDLYVYAHSP